MLHSRSAVTDMLLAAELALEYVAGICEDDFHGNQEKQDAVVRRIEILGEAVSRVDDAVKARFPAVPWREAASMRNRVIHGYDTVDSKVIWDTVQNDFPGLIEQLNVMLEDQTWGEQ